ncbi:hypothetical protein SNEBB_008533 [Seison nebaliae]|nr:hypothetical protein SNEBB_008533 [Seison nebaliae]
MSAVSKTSQDTIGTGGSRRRDIKLTDFYLCKALGEGSFGKVILAYHRQTLRFYAIKVLSKKRIVKSRQIDHTLNERRLLNYVNHPFVVKINFTFKDNSNLYIALEYLSGGDLFHYLRKEVRFKEQKSRFYAAQVFLAFDYLHTRHIVYRDLKPENIMIDSDGYLKIVDFGFAKEVQGRTWTLCGTPDYLAPEIIQNKPYNKAVDWWAFGILVWEMCQGEPPFSGSNHMELYENIVKCEPHYPSRFSSELKDLLKNIVIVDTTKRYGCLRRGSEDIRAHAWFKDVHWKTIYNRQEKAPYVPRIKYKAEPDLYKGQEITLRISATNLYEDEFKDF